jgi:hypothetical protein
LAAGRQVAENESVRSSVALAALVLVACNAAPPPPQGCEPACALSGLEPIAYAYLDDDERGHLGHGRELVLDGELAFVADANVVVDWVRVDVYAVDPSGSVVVPDVPRTMRLAPGADARIHLRNPGEANPVEGFECTFMMPTPGADFPHDYVLDERGTVVGTSRMFRCGWRLRE